MSLRSILACAFLLLLAGCGASPASICDDANNPCGAGLSCIRGTCLEATCGDGVRNGAETGVDCGGSCPQRCANGIACAAARDCTSGICLDGACAASACSNGLKDGDETDVDCGGSCPAKCGFGAGCNGATSCISGICTNGSCAPSCTDRIRDGDESDIDCGGTCATKCAPGARCSTGADCAAVVNGTASCGRNVCGFTCGSGFHVTGSSCAADTNQCCGFACADCTTAFSHGTGACAAGACTLTACDSEYVQVGNVCVSNQSTCCGSGCVDCTTVYANGIGICSGGTCVFVSCRAGFHVGGGSCVPDSCTDSIRNQDESGVDCGGICVTQGRPCADGQNCTVPVDCASHLCAAGVCSSCGAGTHACDNACISNTSTSSCGTSCTPCSAPADPHAHATCNGTSCGSACDGGYILSGGVCVGNTNACCGAECVNCAADNGVGWSCVSGVCKCTSPTACRF